jgi:hypothetical protein
MKSTSKENVQAVFLCRRKTVFGDNGDTTFDDIAMIVHNNTNGATCWFQAPQGAGVKMDGRHVPYPTKAGSTCVQPPPGDDKCWEKGTCACWDTPATTAALACMSCHDSGPLQSSIWGKQWKASGWMPSEQFTGFAEASEVYDTAAEFDVSYKKHVQDLVDCCADPTKSKCYRRSCSR